MLDVSRPRILRWSFLICQFLCVAIFYFVININWWKCSDEIKSHVSLFDLSNKMKLDRLVHTCARCTVYCLYLYLFQNIPKNVHLICSRSRATNIDINKQTHINLESILLKGILEVFFEPREKNILFQNYKRQYDRQTAKITTEYWEKNKVYIEFLNGAYTKAQQY